MVGEEIDLARDQLAHSAELHPGEDRRHTFPEDAMVDEHPVDLGLAGANEELAA